MVPADAPCALRCRFVRMGLRLWRCIAPMGQSDGWRTMGEATADGGEVAYLRHAEVVVEENPGTLRCALHTGLRKSAVALRRESAISGSRFYNRSSAVVARASVSRGRRANPVLTYETALRRFFAYGDDASRRWGNPRVTFMKPLFGGFRDGDASRRGGAFCRNEVFVMRLFCVGFCKIGK